jgi:hypothetical protein
MVICEHCGTEYDSRDGDHIRAGGVGHLPWLCRDALRSALDAYGAAYKLWADALYARGDKPDPWRFTDFVRENVRDAMTKTTR